MRLDQAVVLAGLTNTRSQAESYIRLGMVEVSGKVVTKPGFTASDLSQIRLTAKEQYVSRAALKLASIAKQFRLDFRDKTVLDVGSSTGGFTDYALRHGARKVIAVEVGRDQLHPTLHGDTRIELHEQTDIREFQTNEPIDVVVADVSFISLRLILPHVQTLCGPKTHLVVMAKPQFEAEQAGVKHHGVVKNDRMRRDILKSFEAWVREHFIVLDKADSAVAGEKGNVERFYLLKLMR